MPTRLLPRITSVKKETVGHGCGVDAVHTVKSASSLMTHRRQESTEDERAIAINPSSQATEAERDSADPSRCHHDRRVQDATVLKHRDGAVPHVLGTLVLVTLVDPPPTAEAAAVDSVAPTLGVDRLRQGGDDVTTSTTSPNQTDLEGANATAATALGGHLAVRPREGPIRTEVQLHWDG